MLDPRRRCNMCRPWLIETLSISHCAVKRDKSAIFSVISFILGVSREQRFRPTERTRKAQTKLNHVNHYVRVYSSNQPSEVLYTCKRIVQVIFPLYLRLRIWINHGTELVLCKRCSPLNVRRARLIHGLSAAQAYSCFIESTICVV
jgi:hypothetical protein